MKDRCLNQLLKMQLVIIVLKWLLLFLFIDIQNAWDLILTEKCKNVCPIWLKLHKDIYRSKEWNVTKNKSVVMIRLQKIFEILNYFLFFFFWDGILLCRPGWSAVAWPQLTAVSAAWVQVILLHSASRVAGITGGHHHSLLSYF